MASHPSVNVARLIYLLVCEAAGVAIALSTKGLLDISIGTGLLGGLGVAAFFIWIESLMKGFTLRGFSTASFGLGVGFVLRVAAHAGGNFQSAGAGVAGQAAG